MLKLGNKNISKFYLGNKGIGKAYLGTKLVFESAKPIFVDYIESTGTQYIDTGVIQNSNQKFEIITQPLTLAGNQAFFGSQTGSGSGSSGAKYMFLGIYTNHPGWLVQYGYASDYFNYGTKDLNKHTFVLDLPNLTLNVDDVSYDISASSATISGTYSVWLFARNDNGAGRTFYTGRVYGYKVYENGELIQDLKPCLHPKTFEACMYDMITKQYFYNQGAGEFIAAPRFVEYIESDSTAYIDTGIAGGKDTLTIECKFMYNTFVSYGGIYGNYVSDSHNGIRCILANSKNRMITNNNTICTTSGNTELNCDISQIHTVISKHDTVILDGVATSIQNTAIGTENANNIALFNRSVINPNTSRDIGLRVYDFKISENGTLLRHLRPCLQGNTPCMYDMVTGQYYMNAGTGKFKYGEIKFIDYIESTGTQYIDTGVYAPDVTRFVVKGTCQPNGESNAQLLGTNNSIAATSFFGSRSVGSIWSWYCVINGSTSIGNPLNLSIIDATIVDSKNQTGTLTDLVEGTTQSFDSFVGDTSSFTFVNGNLCIFGGYSSRRSPNATCYDLQLYTADGLVRHLRPALDYNNVVCMYDMITGQYFYNQGEGEFGYSE